MKRFTIVYLRNGSTVILAEKKEKIGAQKLNGYGGGIHTGETPAECAIRELREESGVLVEPQHMNFAGLVSFFNEITQLSYCFIFVADEWKGYPVESKEMGPPQEFQIDELPFGKMMTGDDLWAPRVFRGEKFIGTISYNQDQTKVVQSDFCPLPL